MTSPPTFTFLDRAACDVLLAAHHVDAMAESEVVWALPLRKIEGQMAWMSAVEQP